MQYPGFINGSHTQRSRTAGSERTVNWMVYLPDGTPKSPAWLCPTPGTELFVGLGAAPVRALFYQDGRCFAIGGNAFFEVLANQTLIFRGNLAVDGRPATICSNGTAGHQLFIVSGSLGYIFDLITDSLTQILAPGFPYPAAMGAFCDGYFLVLKRNSIQFNISALFDGLAWDALDVAQVSQSSDNIQALWMNHRDVWLFGSKTTEVWSDIGDPNFPFAPIPGALIMQGTAAAFAPAMVDNTLFWLGANEQGDRVVYRANGYTPQRVSDAGLEFRLTEYPRVDDAIGWTYQQDGHPFYVLYLPTAPTHSSFDHVQFAYDVSTGVWHERAVWDQTYERWTPFRCRAHTFAFGRHLIGDPYSNAVYRMGLDLSSYAFLL